MAESWEEIADSDPAIGAWFEQLRSRVGLPPTMRPSDFMRLDKSYDTPAAIMAGARPLRQKDGSYHWPSGDESTIWKAPTHPTVMLELIDRLKYGVPIPAGYQHLLADNPSYYIPAGVRSSVVRRGKGG